MVGDHAQDLINTTEVDARAAIENDAPNGSFEPIALEPPNRVGDRRLSASGPRMAKADTLRERNGREWTSHRPARARNSNSNHVAGELSIRA